MPPADFSYLKQAKVDETTTVWYPLHLRGMPGAELQLAPLTLDNKRWISHCDRLNAVKRGAEEAAAAAGGTLPEPDPAVVLEKNIDSLASFSLCGWRGIVDGATGQPVTYSIDEGRNFLRAYAAARPGEFQGLLDYAQHSRHFGGVITITPQQTEAVAKNS